MTCFPLQFSRLARTSIRRSAAPVRSGPPLETAIAPPRGPRKDRQRQRQSSLSVMNAGDQACPETRPCPHPSPGDRKPARTLAGKADGTDVLLGNVEFQHRHAAQLNTHANSYAERWVRSVKEECLSRLILFGESSLRRALQQYLEHYHGERNYISGQRQSDFVSFAGGKGEHGSCAVSRTAGRPAEVLRQGSGIRVDGTAGDGLTISHIN